MTLQCPQVEILNILRILEILIIPGIQTNQSKVPDYPDGVRRGDTECPEIVISNTDRREVERAECRGRCHLLNV